MILRTVDKCRPKRILRVFLCSACEAHYKGKEAQPNAAGYAMHKGFNFEEIAMFVGALILVISIILTIVSNKSAADKLPVYTGGDEVSVAEIVPEKKEVEIATDVYVDNETGFSISIPEGWTEVMQDGNTTFIDAASGSSIQIQVSSYDPALNNASAERYMQILNDEGLVFKNFTWKGTTNFELLYQDYQENTYDYIEEVYWDRDTSVTLLCILKDAYYQQMKPYYDKVISSFAWDMKSPVPEGYCLYYDEQFRYEIGVPETWVLADSNGTVCMRDEATGAEMVINVVEYSNDFTSMPVSDMASLVAAGRENYMIGDYNIQSDFAEALATFTSGNILYQSIDALFCNGTYLYSVTCTYEQGMADPAVFDTNIALFRSF